MGEQDSFGQRVKTLRRKHDLTQEELARRVGCAPVTLRKIEYDDLRPSVQIAERLAMALSIPLEERAAFVRQARLERSPFIEPTPTPSPKPEEIGLEDLSGRAIRGYTLGERIGKGGMGVVYRGVQPLVEREVAVKIILPQYANHPDFIRRFETEAQLVARLEHPHIVPLYDYWREPNIAFLVMRLLRGGSLQKLLENGPLPLEIALQVMEQVGSALGVAHRVGVIHRDLKPANILLDEDQNAYLADFGIAKNLGNPNLEDLTQPDAIIGSPNYISPEQIRSEFVRPQSDIYCLGVVLYEILTGQTPFTGPTPIEVMHQHLSAPLPPLAARRSGLPRRLDAIIEHATAKDPLARYANVDNLLVDLRQAIHGETAPLPAVAPTRELPPLTAADNPYKGLRAFGEGDAADFFGRETLIQQLLVRLGEGGDISRLLVIVGPSGSGKSSVVKAGLIPALRRGALPSSENWYIIDLMPGAHPFEEIEAALLRIAVNPPPSLLSQLKEDRRGLLRAVNRCLPEDPSVELVLVIDQFEELFTLVNDEATRTALLDSLVCAVLDERSRLRVVLTLRADFTDRPLQYVDFGEMLRQRMEIVLPMTPDELEHTITGPAEKVGLIVEPELAAAIVRDVGEQPGALPLMQYALTELFERREDRTLTRAAYQQIGGVSGALARRAEAIFGELSIAGQSAARQLFLRLVTLGEGVEDTRRRVLRSEILSLTLAEEEIAIENILEALGRARLLFFDRDLQTRGPTVEVAHEALLREWSRLRIWLDESRDDLRTQRRLAIAAGEWAQSGQEAGFLASGSRLDQFESLAQKGSMALTPSERAYLDDSLAERHAQQVAEAARRQHEAALEKRSRAFLRSLVVVLTLAAAILLGLSSIAYRQARLANARELAAAASNNLQVDSERSLLLAMEAIRTQDIWEARNVLHQAILASRLRLSLPAHSQVAFGVAVSPDGSRFASAGMDSTIKIWKLGESLPLPDSQPLLTISNPIDYPVSMEAGGHTLEFSPDGSRIAAPGSNFSARIWDATSGNLLLSLEGHSGNVLGLSFSPDGKRLATSSGDHTVKIWDTASGEELFTLAGHEYSVYVAVFSPDSRYLASGADDSTIRVWDLESSPPGKELLQLANDEAPGTLAFSSDGKRLASGVGTIAKVWEIDLSPSDATYRLALTLPGHQNSINRILFTSDNSALLTVSADGKARVWDAATGQTTLILASETGAVNSAALGSDGALLLTANSDGTIKAWDISPAGNQEWFAFPAYRARFSLDGKRLQSMILADNNTAKVQTWDLSASGASEVHSVLLDHGARLSAYSSTPDLSRYVTIGADNTARVWDTTSGQELISFTLQNHTGFIFGLVISPDGTRMATGSDDGAAMIWDLSNGQRILTLSGHQGPIRGLAWSRDGLRLATASFDNTARIWDARSGQLLHELAGHSGLVISVTFSLDGQLLATASDDTTARLWDASTGKEILTLAGHASTVFGVDFSPDGKYVATGGVDGTCKLWDVHTGESLLTLPGFWAYFSPDGKGLVTIQISEGMARGFYLDTSQLMSLAQSRLTRSWTVQECKQYLHRQTCP